MSESKPRTRAQRRRSRQIRLSITTSIFLAVVVVLGISLSNGKASSASDSAGVVRDREVATAAPEQDKAQGKDKPRTTSTPKAVSPPDAEGARDPQVGIAPEPTSATSVSAEGGMVPVISRNFPTLAALISAINRNFLFYKIGVNSRWSPAKGAPPEKMNQSAGGAWGTGATPWSHGTPSTETSSEAGSAAWTFAALARSSAS